MNSIWPTVLLKLLIYALEKLSPMLPKLVAQWKDDKKKIIRKEEQDKAKAEYDAVASKPEATAAEKAKAYEKLINSGRY